MRIFAVDTSAKSASAALVEDGIIKGEYFINTMLTHSETLMPMIDLLFKSVRISPSEVDYFAVNSGPGSFTGLRIGIAAVKGMTFALNKPCVSVSTLESMAYNFDNTDALVCAVMDARCSQVYNALFEVKSGKIKRLCDDRALRIDELADELKACGRQVLLVGDGAKLCYSKMKDILPEIYPAPENLMYQRASSTAFAAMNLIENGSTLTSAQLMPKYLRLPQAERELLAKKKAEK